MHRHFDKILSPRFEEYEEATRYPEPQLQQVKVLEPHLACRLGIPSGHHEDVVSHKQVSDPVLAHQMNRAQAETKKGIYAVRKIMHVCIGCSGRVRNKLMKLTPSSPDYFWYCAKNLRSTGNKLFQRRATGAFHTRTKTYLEMCQKVYHRFSWNLRRSCNPSPFEKSWNKHGARFKVVFTIPESEKRNIDKPTI